jgi:hypothetical protein
VVQRLFTMVHTYLSMSEDLAFRRFRAINQWQALNFGPVRIWLMRAPDLLRLSPLGLSLSS